MNISSCLSVISFYFPPLEVVHPVKGAGEREGGEEEGEEWEWEWEEEEGAGEGEGGEEAGEGEGEGARAGGREEGKVAGGKWGEGVGKEIQWTTAFSSPDLTTFRI